MTRRGLRAVASTVAMAAALLAGWVTSARAELDAVSPGPLAAPHARLEKRCAACHVSFGGVPARQCLTCHTALAKRLAADRGYHASVKSEACVTCHPEHRGRDAALAPPPPEGFRHSTTIFPLEGAHAALPCESCHGKAPSAQRWVGLGTACTSCHADRAHRGALGSACQQCHGARGWTPVKVALADHRTPMTGGHSALTCVSCHRAGVRLTAERGDCAQCHRRPHGGTTGACETCHQVSGWKQVTYQHAFSWDRLPGPHQAATCLACHPAFRFRGAALACASCHDRQRPHEPMGACESCHSARSWKDVRFDHSQPGIDFPLLGKHESAPCAGCHPRQGTFRGAPRTCEECHRDAHGGQFGAWPAGQAARGADPTAAAPTATPPAPAPLAPAPRRAECARCHRVAGWVPSTITAETHSAFGYPLQGAHANARCAGCHPNGRFAGTPSQCSACHDDRRHRGRLGQDCARCHASTSWAPAARFDHAVTGVALEGAHAHATCKSCHGPDGRRLVGAASPISCQRCHPPVRHGLALGSRCEQCHRPTRFADVPRFDHAARTDFALELRHATLPCLSCHDTRKRSPVNQDCRTCHGDPHRASNGFDCLDCHRSDRWRIIRFDHDLTAYPLVGKHRVAGCGGCHTNPNWTGVRTDCLACHAFDRPAAEDHPPELSCDDCHTPTSWKTILR